MVRLPPIHRVLDIGLLYKLEIQVCTDSNFQAPVACLIGHGGDSAQMRVVLKLLGLLLNA